MKDKRIHILKECIDIITSVQKFYVGSSSGWVLLHAAKCHVKSLHHLEAETKFDEKTLGVKAEENL